MAYGRVSSKWGNIICGIDEDGYIFGLWFENQKYFPRISEDEVFLNDIETEDQVHRTSLAGFKQLTDQVRAFEQGRLKNFDLPLKPRGTEFRLLIWKLLLEIPYGETTTYGELGKKAAVALGRETMSAQAVGGAVGHNPISIIVPCHRVVGSDGSLTGYAGGIEKKEGLLQHEKMHK